MAPTRRTASSGVGIGTPAVKSVTRRPSVRTSQQNPGNNPKTSDRNKEGKSHNAPHNGSQRAIATARFLITARKKALRGQDRGIERQTLIANNNSLARSLQRKKEDNRHLREDILRQKTEISELNDQLGFLRSLEQQFNERVETRVKEEMSKVLSSADNFVRNVAEDLGRATDHLFSLQQLTKQYSSTTTPEERHPNPTTSMYNNQRRTIFSRVTRPENDLLGRRRNGRSVPCFLPPMSFTEEDNKAANQLETVQEHDSPGNANRRFSRDSRKPRVSGLFTPMVRELETKDKVHELTPPVEPVVTEDTTVVDQGFNSREEEEKERGDEASVSSTTKIPDLVTKRRKTAASTPLPGNNDENQEIENNNELNPHSTEPTPSTTVADDAPKDGSAIPEHDKNIEVKESEKVVKATPSTSAVVSSVSVNEIKIEPNNNDTPEAQSKETDTTKRGSTINEKSCQPSASTDRRGTFVVKGPVLVQPTPLTQTETLQKPKPPLPQFLVPSGKPPKPTDKKPKTEQTKTKISKSDAKIPVTTECKPVAVAVEDDLSDAVPAPGRSLIQHTPMVHRKNKTPKTETETPKRQPDVPYLQVTGVSPPIKPMPPQVQQLVYCDRRSPKLYLESLVEKPGRLSLDGEKKLGIFAFRESMDENTEETTLKEKGEGTKEKKKVKEKKKTKKENINDSDKNSKGEGPQDVYDIGTDATPPQTFSFKDRKAGHSNPTPDIPTSTTKQKKRKLGKKESSGTEKPQSDDHQSPPKAMKTPDSGKGHVQRLKHLFQLDNYVGSGSNSEKKKKKRELKAVVVEGNEDTEELDKTTSSESTETDDTKDRRSRRNVKICYKEPPLGTKLRRGDNTGFHG